VTGQGYGSDGQIRRVAGAGETDLDPILLPMVLCSDAVVQDGELVGDPTEGALVVLAQKGGIMVRATRQTYPRIAEVPFDSAYKLMATFHNMVKGDNQPVVRCYVKGAPDVLIARSASILGAGGGVEPLDEGARQQALDLNEELASQGMRVMVVAGRDLDPATFDPEADLLDEVDDLTLLGMVGIVDPPRPEAKAAIAECVSAGIRVRMITGDHAVTAGAIAGELGIEGRAITGAEWAAMSDQEATSQIDDIGVIARVAPEDKVRLVNVLKGKNNIVAMTGDGVNDAPALKTADIGVAMGITGTDVSKEASVMILTDDNFATIVGAVEYGRIIYDNLLKYLRFQMAALFGFILAFLGAAAFGVTLVLFAPLQILFVNFAVQMPIGASLGFDSPTPGLMKRKPRPADEKILTWPLAIRLVTVGLIAALFAIIAYDWTKDSTGSTAAAQTMAMVMFSILSIPISLSLRHPDDTVFREETFSNRQLWLAYGWILLVLILVTEIPLLQKIFETEPLTPQQWGICLIAVVFFLLVSEIIKLILRLIRKRS
jgi:Ca2+-transporting ATPase